MSELLFRDDSYRREAAAAVLDVTGDGGIVIDSALFYPTGGGQPGDAGHLTWSGGETRIETTHKDADGRVVLLAAPGERLPGVGDIVIQHIDWERRYLHMRMHTALHLLSVVIPLPVTGGAIGLGRGRLDFDMPSAPQNREHLEDGLNALVAADLPVRQDWITEAELDADPGLVKTLSVQPPRGSGLIRLIRIGRGQDQVDVQPCGGTHVARTGEIGPLRLGKIENKGARNRRVTLHLD